MGKGIPIHVLGTNFTIQTDENPAYVEKLVEYVCTKIRTLEQSVGTKESLRIAVLASVLIADELFKEREKPAAAETTEGVKLKNMTDHMIARLDAALDG